MEQTLFSKEEYIQMRMIQATDGRPVNQTREHWKNEFEIRKRFIRPNYVERITGSYAKENPSTTNIFANNSLYDSSYKGATNYQQYNAFISDVISQLLKGDVDYVYYVYQIEDLYTRFGDYLITEYLEDSECWSVRLDRKYFKDKSDLRKKLGRKPTISEWERQKVILHGLRHAADSKNLHQELSDERELS